MTAAGVRAAAGSWTVSFPRRAEPLFQNRSAWPRFGTSPNHQSGLRGVSWTAGDAAYGTQSRCSPVSPHSFAALPHSRPSLLSFIRHAQLQAHQPPTATVAPPDRWCRRRCRPALAPAPSASRPDYGCPMSRLWPLSRRVPALSPSPPSAASNCFPTHSKLQCRRLHTHVRRAGTLATADGGRRGLTAACCSAVGWAWQVLTRGPMASGRRSTLQQPTGQAARAEPC